VTTAAALSLALLSITVLVLALGLAIVGGRTARRLRVARRVKKTTAVRPILLAMLAQEDQEATQDALALLLALDKRSWAALEPTVTQLLGKLRGSSHDLLRTLVELRGTVRRARDRIYRLGAVRRARSAEILGGLEDPAVTGDLVRLLSDRDPEVRQVAARALGRSGDARAAGPLLTCLAEKSVPPRVVSQALLRLGSGAEPALVRALAAEDEMIRAIAVEILGLSSAIGASRAVQRCLVEDTSFEVRIRAARSLGRVGMPSALEALIRATDPEQPTPLRAVAARALGDLGHASAVPRLRQLLRDPAHRVASNAGRSLASLGPKGEAALVEETLKHDQGPGAAHARDALSRAHVREVWLAEHLSRAGEEALDQDDGAEDAMHPAVASL
jgi:HEAT repeat protein